MKTHGEGQKISVVMPTFKNADYLCQAVESILAQTIPPDEIIIINDCPTDTLVQKILKDRFAAEMKTEQIIYRKNQKNLGASGSRNHGASLARGDLIIFCDSDDLYTAEHFETFLRLRDQKDADVVICHTKSYIDEEGQLLHRRKKPWRGDTEYKLFILGMTGSCMMMPPKIFADLGGFNTEIAASHDKKMFAEDWDLLVRAFHKRYKIAMDDSGTYLHREHDDSLTGSSFNWTKHKREVIFPRIVADPNFTRKQLAIFSYGTLVSAPLRQVPALLAQTLKFSPLFFVTEPAWPQLTARSLSNRVKRRVRVR